MKIENTTQRTSFGINTRIISKKPINGSDALKVAVELRLVETGKSTAYPVEISSLEPKKHWVVLDHTSDEGVTIQVLERGTKIPARPQEEVEAGKRNIDYIINRIYRNRDLPQIQV